MTRHLLTLLAVVLGALAVTAGEADDSPGLGGIGLVVIAVALVLWVRARRQA